MRTSLLLAAAATLLGCSQSSGRTAETTQHLGGYAGHLTHVFCDVKRPLHGEDGALHDSDYASVLDGFEVLGCDGVRVYIDPDKPHGVYEKHYTDFVDAARGRGMRIYANPLGTGDFGKTDDEYVDWIVTYANEFQPHFLGPFNEAGMDLDRMARIASRVSQGLNYWGPQIVGPDTMHVDWSLGKTKEPLLDWLDVASSHNAAGDDSATVANWNALSRAAAGRPAWSSENPRDWHATNAGGEEVGIKAVVAARIDALVIYEAYPRRVAADGSLVDDQAWNIAIGLLP